MYNSFQLAAKYARQYLRASNSKGHGMHSPFVFAFICNVLNNDRDYIPPVLLEELRKSLLKDERLLCVEDYGAGSRKDDSRKRKVKNIAASALKPKNLAEVIYRLARYYNPKTIVELGTSLGLTTCYLSYAAPKARLVTIEGSREIAAIAGANFAKASCYNIEQVVGNFNDVLSPLLQELNTIDLAYIDGNHRYGPTINYFHQFAARSHAGTILVFDDIHWSAEMEKAWDEIRTHPSVQYTIDIFFLGFVFFRKEFRVKQDFTVRF